jgi:hypothetical protein
LCGRLDQIVAIESLKKRFATNSRDEILLEPKDSMKRRGVASPDIADALACTFACEYATLPVRDWDTGRGDHLVKSEWNPFSDERMRDDGMQSARRLQAPRYYAEGWAKLREDD